MTSCQTCAYYDPYNEWCTEPDINMLVTGGYFQSCASYKEYEEEDQMTDRKEPDLLFDQLCAIIRTTKNILKYHYRVTDEEIDQITSLERAYNDD